MPPQAHGPTPADTRNRLGKIVKDLARDPRNFGTRINDLVSDNYLTDAQADAMIDMLAEVEAQSDFNAKARGYAELGNEITENIAYFIGRGLVQPTADPEAVSVRRDAYVAAGAKWLRRNLPNL
ncbi:hypothetical protein J4449_01315 [Candidatus Woesearchaeota archaeon]|nr:hypothetical protein [Candidatus Woesearchaeota archaeon]